MKLEINLSEKEIIKGLSQNFYFDLPEISSKKYADLSGMTNAYVVKLCNLSEKAGGLPARKLNATGQVKNLDDKGTWFVNLVKLRENLQG